MKLFLLFCVLFTFATATYSAESFPVPKFSVKISAPDIMNKIETAISGPENILKRYIPVGGNYRNKVVNQNTVSFTMSKTVIIFTKTFFVNFSIDIRPENNICPKDQIGYLYSVNLDGSDAIITENIDHLTFNICIQKNSPKDITAIVTGKIFKGRDYSEPIGGIAKDTIEQQVGPIVNAIKEEVQAL